MQDFQNLDRPNIVIVIVMATKVFENGIVSDLLNYEVKCVFYLNSFIFMDNSEVVKLYFFYASPEKM